MGGVPLKGGGGGGYIGIYRVKGLGLGSKDSIIWYLGFG